jgi:hypothetical protein
MAVRAGVFALIACAVGGVGVFVFLRQFFFVSYLLGHGRGLNENGWRGCCFVLLG